MSMGSVREVEITIRLPRPHKGQKKILDEMRRYNVICCGRRFGKSWLLIILLIQAALTGKPVAWCSPTYKMLSDIWRMVKYLTAPITERVNSQEHRIELKGGGIIDFWSLEEPDNIRGRKYFRIVVDEAAMVKKLKEIWENILRATLMDYNGDIFFASTPKGLDFFYEMWRRGQDAKRPSWKSWQMPTLSNPYIQPSEVAEAAADLPDEVYQQEYLAKFLAGGGMVFRNIQAALDTERGMVTCLKDGPEEGHEYVIGCDWAKRRDFSVFTVLDMTTKTIVAIDRQNKVDYTIQVRRLSDLCDKWKPYTVISEENSGDAIHERVQEYDNIPLSLFRTTNASKQKAIERLIAAFDHEEIVIPNDPILVGELGVFESRRTPSGNMVYGAPEGSHDDMVMSLAIAWSAVEDKQPLILWGDEDDDPEILQGRDLDELSEGELYRLMRRRAERERRQVA